MPPAVAGVRHYRSLSFWRSSHCTQSHTGNLHLARSAATDTDRTTREFGGLGLGLAISKATVDAHDGTMSAESAGTNRGTTITITLPLA